MESKIFSGGVFTILIGHEKLGVNLSWILLRGSKYLGTDDSFLLNSNRLRNETKMGLVEGSGGLLPLMIYASWYFGLESLIIIQICNFLLTVS